MTVDTQKTTPQRPAEPQSGWRGRLSREARSLRKVWRPRFAFFSACAGLLPDFALASVRAQLYRMAGCDIAPGAAVLGRMYLIGEGDLGRRLHIGEGCIVAPGVTFGLDGEITLGKNVSISPGATLYTGTHSLGFGSRRMNPAASARPVVVEDGVWVGMRSLILPGVTLGRGSVVSAGSVVAENVAANTAVGGNPAAVQRSLPFGDR
jgi:maltose O-acetyltransferase